MRPFTTATFLPDHATAATVGVNNYCYTSSTVNNHKSNINPPLFAGGVGGARYTPQPFYPNPKFNALIQNNSNGRNHPNSLNTTPAKPKLSLGDLTSGKAFENGCTCFESCKAAVNDLCGRKTYCKYFGTCLRGGPNDCIFPGLEPSTLHAFNLIEFLFLRYLWRP